MSHVQPVAGILLISAYLVMELTEQLDVNINPFLEDHMESFLRHQHAECHTQAVCKESIFKTLRRLLGVTDLRKVAALKETKTKQNP